MCKNALKVKITVMRKTEYKDLMDLLEIKQENPCDMKIGDVYISENGEIPKGFCESAFETLRPFVTQLSEGGGKFYGDWMKNEKSALLSCNDGFRPVSFLIETMDE